MDLSRELDWKQKMTLKLTLRSYDYGITNSLKSIFISKLILAGPANYWKVYVLLISKLNRHCNL